MKEVFVGRSESFGGKTTVAVTVEDGEILQIDITDMNDTKAVSANAERKIPQRIIAAQSTEIDAVSGATKSSQGIIDAVQNALEKQNIIGGEMMAEQVKQTNFAEEFTADIVIIGSGISGLSAAVQAGEDGLKTVVLEKLGATGGNGSGVEGQFAVNSRFQKELGIDISSGEIMHAEHDMGQYRANGAIWLDLINSSAENIEWCIENGVKYSGQVDNYHTGLYETMHWFDGGHASDGFVPQMTAKAEEYGVAFHFNTPARELIKEGNRVVGVIAENEDGKLIKYHAKTVIIATGGIGGNEELIQRQGWDTNNMKLTGMPSNVGDGYKMATNAGALDTISESTQLIMNYVQAFPTDAPLLYMDPINGIAGFTSGGEVLFVNEEGDRFVNENIYSFNMMLQSMAMKQNKASYAIFTRQMFLDFATGVNVTNAAEILDKAVAVNKGNTLFEVGSFEELATSFDLPQENLLATIKRYNELAHKGEDIDLNKDAEVLRPIEDGPFYIAQIDQNYLVGIGGIGTNKRFEVIDANKDAIPGLYSTGMDGVTLYKDVYTMNMPGTACAFNVHSGRNSVKNAQKVFDFNLATV